MSDERLSCNSDDVCLIATIDSNHNERLYEDEAIRCFKSWRKNGGWLKSIKIFALLSTNSNISQTTIDELQKLDVVIIKKYDNNIPLYPNMYFTIPYCGKFFEDIKMNYKFKIHINLDMTLLRPLPHEWFIDSTTTLIGLYDSISALDLRKSECLPFDTGFLISSNELNFYKCWYDLCFNKELKLAYDLQNKNDIISKFLIEYVADYMYINKIKNITPVKYYLYGEGYASIDTYTDEQIEMIYFLHEHIYRNNKFPVEYNAIHEHMQYLKRIKK